jgi:hypothetical protein
MLGEVLNGVPLFSFVSCSVNVRNDRFIAMAGLQHSERCVQLRNDFFRKACLLF